MILMVLPIVKVLLPVILIAVVYFFLRNRVERFQIIGICVLTIVFALIANWVSSFVPPLRDEITLTALGEKNAEAKAEEVFLQGYTIDGKEYICGKDLDIRDGKWFWTGEVYCWRIESDTRQPEGVTRSITIGIPVGLDRSLNFESNDWRGLVEISASDKTWTVDTFSADGEAVKATISQSAITKLLFNQARYLLVYFIVLLTQFCLFLRVSIHNPLWVNRNGGRIIYLTIAIFAFALMQKYAGVQSLWNDELARLTYSSGTLREAIGSCLHLYDMTPPLFIVCAHFWTKIAPYGECWLLLISIIPISIAIYFIGLCGEELGGKICGVFAAIIAAFSTTAWDAGAYEFSSYSFMILFTTLSLYGHIKKNTQREKNKWLVFYSVCLSGLAMSHYFGMLACVEFFLADLVLYLNKMASKKSGYSYIMPGGLIVVWISLIWITTLRHTSPEQLASWYGVPNVGGVRDILSFLTGYVEWEFWLLLFSFGGAVAEISRLSLKYVKCTWRSFYQIFSGAVIIGTLLLLFVYGNYINRESTMWQSRYFLFLLPFVFLSISLMVCSTFESIAKENQVIFAKISFTVFFGVYTMMNCVIAMPARQSFQPFRESADWLYSQSNSIYKSDTLIISGVSYADTWEKYYIERNGNRDPLNVVGQAAVNEELLEPYNTVYFQYSHAEMLPKLKSLLDDGFSLQNDISNLNIQIYVRNAKS